MDRTWTWSLGCALAVGIVVPAWAGVRMVHVNKYSGEAGGAAQSGRTTYRATPDRARVDTDCADGHRSIVFRKDLDLFWTLDHDARTYTEVTRADLDRMRQEMERAYKEMEAALKQMPPEQREAMERQMAAMRRAVRTTYRKVGSGEAVKDWTCDHWIGERTTPGLPGQADVKETEDVWTTPLAALGLNAGDLAAFNTMDRFFKDLAGTASAFFPQPGDGEAVDGGYTGVPVKVEVRAAGRLKFETGVEEVAREDIDASVFEVPKGYRKEAGPGGMGPPGGPGGHGGPGRPGGPGGKG